MMTRTLALSLLLCAPALAQETPATPAPKPAPTAPTVVEMRMLKAQLSDAVGDLLRAIRDGKPEVATKVLAAWKPTQADIDAVLSPEGREALGAKILATAEETFAGTPAEVGGRLGLDVAKVMVTVHPETTEGLEAMAHESNASLHFASALRRTSRFFQKRLQWYSVSMLPREAPADAVGDHLQVFARVGDRFVYFGQLWKLDPEYKAPGAQPEEGGKPAPGGPGGALGQD